MEKSHALPITKSLVALILVCVTGCHKPGIKTLQQEVDRVISQYVPDQRTGLCKVTVITGKNGSLILKGETNKSEIVKPIIKALDNNSKTLIDSIVILPDTTLNKKYKGLVTLSVINLRKHPDHAAELVSQARMGTPLVILKDKGSWLLIQTPDNYISWTEKSSVVLLDNEEMTNWKKADRLIFTDNTGWLYDTTLAGSGVISDLVSGDILIKTAEIRDFYCAVLPDGRKGYISKQKVADFNTWKNSTECSVDNVIKIASSYMGVPYLWGGSSVKGVDCSGFVQSVFFLNAVVLQRDASLQALYGMNIDISNGYSQLVKGDLLFFGSKINGTPHVTHVAIYMGNNDYINSAGRVMISSLDSTKSNYIRYRLTSLLSARRICGVTNEPGIVPVKKHPWY